MNAHPVIRAAATVVAVALSDSSSFAGGRTCSNTCVTMSVPKGEGVVTRFDGTADAALWPATRELREIRVAALNDRGRSCDVTIDDVQQDEAPEVAGSGLAIDDAVDCDNEGDESTVMLRSDRDADGDGRYYQVRFHLADPDCRRAARSDDLVIVVPLDETATADLKAVAAAGPLTASHATAALECTPLQRDARLH